MEAAALFRIVPSTRTQYVGCHATSVLTNSLGESQLPTLSEIPAGASLRFWG